MKTGLRLTNNSTEVSKELKTNARPVKKYMLLSIGWTLQRIIFLFNFSN